MKVVVTGGTGFIGRAFVRALTERGDDVTVLSRGGSHGDIADKVPHFGHHGRNGGARPMCCRGAGDIDLAAWTPDRAGKWTRAIDGADAVVHLAGAGVLDERWSPERCDVLRSSRVRSTELLAEAIAKAERKPKVFLSGSAVGFYGTHVADRVLDENAPAGEDFLAKLVSDWEDAAGAARDAGVRVCHPRIGIVLGRGGGILAKMLPAFRAFVGGPIGSGRQYLGWVHITDAVRAMEAALDDARLDGPFNVTAPEPVTMDTFAHVLGGVMGRPSLFRVPDIAVKMAVGQGAEAILTGQRAVPRRLVERGFAFVFPEISSALADLVAS